MHGDYLTGTYKITRSKNSVGLSSKTHLEGHATIPLPAQANLIPEPPRCLALRTRGGRLRMPTCSCSSNSSRIQQKFNTVKTTMDRVTNTAVVPVLVHGYNRDMHVIMAKIELETTSVVGSVGK